MATPQQAQLTYKSTLPQLKDEAGRGDDAPDDRSGRVYVHDAHLRLAVEVALTTGRPLLLRGKPGTGKSSLAAYLARNLNWRYYEQVVTSTTEARDLLWTIDMVSRLADAHSHKGKAQLGMRKYINPGMLWWAMSPETARRRGIDKEWKYATPDAVDPFVNVNAKRDPRRAVLLIDEIDKADPDLPNSLLVPLGSGEFHVDPIHTTIRRDLEGLKGADWPLSPILVIITTNEERDLPEAFLRRCIVHELPEPDSAELTQIALAHFGPEKATVFEKIAPRLIELRKEAAQFGARAPSTAEYLDAVRTCMQLDIAFNSDTWGEIERLTLRKHRTLSDAEP